MHQHGLNTARLLGILALAGCEDEPGLGPAIDSGGGQVVAVLDAAAAEASTPVASADASITPPSGSDAGAVRAPDAAATDAAMMIDATAATDAAVSDAAPTPGPATSPFPPVSDFARPGPFMTTITMNVGPDNNYAVYMPEGAPPAGAKFPLVGWMSGGATTHDWYELLPHLASHGFVIVTANTVPGIGEEAELGRQIIAGIDWAVAESSRQGSALAGRVDATKIAAAGYSMGSLATFTIAADPRLTTTVHISGGNMAPEPVHNLRAPAAFICGTPNPSCTPLDILSEECDIAAANCDTDFLGATTPVFYANFPGGHLGIMTSPHMERISAMTAAWLRRHLMGDATLARLFVGKDCGYCSDSNWKVQQKNL